MGNAPKHKHRPNQKFEFKKYLKSITAWILKVIIFITGI